jgi:hypothetical protein
LTFSGPRARETQAINITINGDTTIEASEAFITLGTVGGTTATRPPISPSRSPIGRHPAREH